jgi:chorismate mutase
MERAMTTMRCRGIRGATTAEANTAEAILTSTRELLGRLAERNRLDVAEIASAFFTVTDDLDTEYPALAARQMGWGHIALLCAREISVPARLERCVRVLLHVNTERTQEEMRHVYLRGAGRLRPEYAEVASTTREDVAAPGLKESER